MNDQNDPMVFEYVEVPSDFSDFIKQVLFDIVPGNIITNQSVIFIEEKLYFRVGYLDKSGKINIEYHLYGELNGKNT